MEGEDQTGGEQAYISAAVRRAAGLKGCTARKTR